MGGDDCVRNTRIPVWLLVSMRRQGQTDTEILDGYDSLDTTDLAAAWNHFELHSDRVVAQSMRHST